MMHAHRVALTLYLGELLPVGMVVDHVCGNGLCCNPRHLELVTQAENTRRARRTIEEIRAPRWGLPEERLVSHPLPRVYMHKQPPGPSRNLHGTACLNPL